MKTISLHSISSAKNIAFAALFSALCCIGSILLIVPLPNGYFNTGDVFVLLSGWCLGPIYGSFAAAIGSALADVLSSFTVYAPATFFIKGLEAFLAFWVWKMMKNIFKNEKLDVLARSIAAVCGGLFMILGYFLFECILYGFGGAMLSLLGNLSQAICCGICAVILIGMLYPIKAIKVLFPTLKKQ